MPFEVAAAPGASPTAQPYVDVNGSPEPLKATSGSSHVLLLPMPTVTDSPSAPQTGNYQQTALLPDTSYSNDSYQYSLYLAVQYDGAAARRERARFPSR